METPWYPGSVQIFAEPYVALITTPTKTYYVGLDLILRHTLLTWNRVSPYIEGGAGIIHTNLRQRALGGTIEFTPQVGAGFYVHVTERFAVNAGYRLHHISNAGTASQNLGVNSSKPYGGFTFFF
jgi:opacity protein-like surface antigen